ncbi:MAG: valine--pyruvate transaminase [Akkermansiaceae bacterium]|jgi:valine--pyruvate aminotransferase
MAWELSKFGKNLCEGSGIGELMDDLGEALAGGGEVKMLGGGQPAHVPEVDAVWRRRMEEIMSEPGRFEKTLGNYDVPAGNEGFRKALAGLFCREFGWKVTEENFAVTMGGQSAFFFLFNALAGRFEDGRRKKVLLPLLPEYIGYANQSVGADFFEAIPAKIEKTGRHEFKYRVDFEALDPGDEIAAICVSRPTNPSGNVLTDEEIEQLRAIARAKGIPLIIDNAYGAPFPNVIFSDVTPVWDDGMILTLSLSKIGLPGTRTGIVVANKEVCRQVSSMTSIVGLANANLGQEILRPLVDSGEILNLSRNVVRPFYEERSRVARALFAAELDDSVPYFIHRSEGALFLWLWFEDLPISSKELYQRLKGRGVLVVPSEYFFFGLPEDMDWKHTRECIRVSYTMDPDTVETGIKVIADEVNAIYRSEKVV